MSFGALGLRLAGALSGDRSPLPVQAGLPRSSSSKSGGAISDCRERPASMGLDDSLPKTDPLNVHGAARLAAIQRSDRRGKTRIPLFVLALMVAPLLVVVTVGLWLTL